MDGSGQYDNPGSELDEEYANFTCEQLLELGNPHLVSKTIANPLRYTQLIFYMICYPTAFVLNAFVLFIVARFKKLHNITFYLALQIIIANLANIIVYYPYASANAIANKNVSLAMCPILGFLGSFLLAARSLLMFVLVADRFCLIFLPFWYSRHRARVAMPLSIGGWVVALTVTISPVISLPNCYALNRVTWTCSLAGMGCDMPQCNAYSVFLNTLTNGSTFIAFLLYSALYCKAKKIRNRITVSMPSESAEVREAEREARKRDRRANTTFMILFTALLGVTLPQLVFSTFVRLRGISSAAQNIAPRQPTSIFVIVLVFLTNLILFIFITDPIVIMRNQDVREVMATITAKLHPGSGRRRIGPESTATTGTTD